jgi:hypothetical protein
MKAVSIAGTQQHLRGTASHLQRHPASHDAAQQFSRQLARVEVRRDMETSFCCSATIQAMKCNS